MVGLDTTFLVHLEVQEAEAHAAAMEVLRRDILGRDREAALAPQVLAEFVPTRATTGCSACSIRSRYELQSPFVPGEVTSSRPV